MENYRPRTILSAAITLDGKLATRIGDSKLSSKIDKIRVHKLRSKVDAILVGKRTVEIDDPLLSVRRIKTKNPVRVILDSRGTINTNCRILRTCSKIPTIIAVSKKAGKKDLERLKEFPVTVIVCGKDKVDINFLVTEKETGRANFSMGYNEEYGLTGGGGFEFANQTINSGKTKEFFLKLINSK